MATSTSQSGSTVETSDRLSRYDFLLAAMPVPLLAGLAGAVVAGLPMVGGMGVGSLLSAALLAYGLFFDAPTPT